MALKNIARIIKTKEGDVLIYKALDHEGNLLVHTQVINEFGNLIIQTQLMSFDDADTYMQSYTKEDALLFINQQEQVA